MKNHGFSTPPTTKNIAKTLYCRSKSHFHHLRLQAVPAPVLAPFQALFWTHFCIIFALARLLKSVLKMFVVFIKIYSNLASNLASKMAQNWANMSPCAVYFRDLAAKRCHEASRMPPRPPKIDFGLHFGSYFGLFVVLFLLWRGFQYCLKLFLRGLLQTPWQKKNIGERLIQIISSIKIFLLYAAIQI